MDFDNPQTFCEKLQWLKIHDRNPEYTTMVDKYAVKDYVKEVIGEQYIIPTIGQWHSPEDIEWDKLPNQFVLKTTYGGGSFGVIICKDKSKFDRVKAVKQLNRSLLLRKFGNPYREHPYDNVPQRIIAETFMEDIKADGTKSTDLNDYKFYCFNGEPKYCQVIRDRSLKETIDFYDIEWNHQEFVGLNPAVEHGLTPVEKPQRLSEMVSICKKLSERIPFARIDLYEISGKIYFGEITFYPASGLGRFNPAEWDTRLGTLISLN